MISRVKIFGLQRSGTKYLALLIDKNFEVSVDGHGDKSLGWKHSLPKEKRPDLQGPLATKDLIENCPGLLVLVVRKDLGKWLQSIAKNHGDLHVYRPKVAPKVGHVDPPQAKQLWKAFHDAWEGHPGAYVEIVDYRDIILDYEAFLESLETRHGLKRTQGKFVDIENITKTVAGKHWGANEQKFTEQRRKHDLKSWPDHGHIPRYTRSN